MWKSIDRGQSGITRVAGMCGMFIPVVIFTSLSVSIASSPWFTWTQHALSDLGIQENTAALFNYGMIFGGILALVFSFGLMKILSNKTWGICSCAQFPCLHRNWCIPGNHIYSSFYNISIFFCPPCDCIADHWIDQ